MPTPPQRPKALSKIQSEDPALNRFQDQLIEKLNPLLRAPVTETDGSLYIPIATTEAAGRVLTSTGSSWAGAAAPSGGGGWQTAYEIDFTAQATQNLITGGDGAKTIDGKTWGVVGTASCTTCGITNGTGLVLQSATAGVSLQVFSEFAALNATLAPFDGDEIEVWIKASFANLTANAEYAYFGVANVGSAMANWLNWMMSFGRAKLGGGDDQFQQTYYNGGAGASAGYTQVAEDVFVLRFKDPRYVEVALGTWAAGWPSRSAIRPYLSLNIISSTALISPTSMLLNATPGIFFLTYGSGANDAKLTITNMRVMYK